MVKNILFGEPPFPGEGEPASKKELKQMSGKEYVSQNIDPALDYYIQKRYEVMKQTGISESEKIEMISYYDRQRTIRTVEDEAAYKQYFAKSHNLMEGKFIEGAVSSLTKLLADEHMHFGPDVSFVAPKKQPLSGLSFHANVDDIEYYNEKQTEMRIDITIVELDKPDIMHHGSIYIDKETNKIRVAVCPDGLHTKYPSAYVKKLFSIPQIEMEAILSIANLTKSIKYNPIAYQGRRVGASNLSKEVTPTKIEDETPSVLPYRRRMIDDISQLQDTLNDLDSNWNNEERKVLQNAGGGDIIMRIYSYDSQLRDYFYMGNAPLNNLALISNMANQALTGNSKVLITFEHAWRPPELDNAPAGKLHRPHTRRLRGGLVLAIGGSIPQKEKKEILDLWRKRKTGLADDKREKLRSFLDRYGLSQDVDIDLVIANGIHLKDGRFVESIDSELSHAYSL